MTRPLWLVAAAALAATALSGCEPANESAPSAPPAGTVTVLMTDAPTDDFSAINVTISRIELIPADDDSDADSDSGRGDTADTGGDSDSADSDSDSDSDRLSKVTLFEGSATFDLLQLENFSSLFAITPDVPAGAYSKIRLSVEALEVVEIDTGNVVAVELPGKGRLDLKSRDAFLVEPNTNLLVSIDLDAKKSIKIKEKKDGYKFRPVVIVTVENAPPDTPDDPVLGKFVRVQGFVNRADAGTSTLGLQLGGVGGEQFNIALDLEAPIFHLRDGVIPIDFRVLDSQATAVGTFDPNDPTVFKAVVVNVGTFVEMPFAALGGVADGAPVNGLFQFTPDGGAQITVALIAQTQIFNQDGDPADAQVIAAGTRLEIEGLAQVTPAGDVFQASFVLALDGQAPTPDLVQLAGEVTVVDGSSFTLATATGDRCVRAEGATIWVTTETPDSVNVGPGTLADVVAGATLDAYGAEAVDGCLDARQVIVFNLL